MAWVGLVLASLTLPSPVAHADPLADAGASSLPPPPSVQAPIVVFNRKVAILRGPLLGVSATDRARRAEQWITTLLDRAGRCQVSVRHTDEGDLIFVDGALAFAITPLDVDRLAGQTLGETSGAAKKELERVVLETREARNKGRLLSEAGRAGVATLVFLVVVLLMLAARSRFTHWVNRIITERAEGVRVGAKPVVDPMRFFALSRWLVSMAAFLVIALVAYRWLSFVLNQFPYTRAWGEELDGFLVGVALQIGGSIVGALPSLAIVAVIFLLARAVIGIAKPLFHGIERNLTEVSWLDHDTVRPTRRLFNAGVWVFAVVMAYPYLPGSGSEAFKGISVLIGLMVTLGGSSLFGQAASGLILLYSRTLRLGELVRIGEHEGTVSELGTFTTKIRSGFGDEVTLPNAFVLGTVTKNYSRLFGDKGFLLTTTVTIGYDTPWRQVEALLVDAANRTEGVAPEPAPRVFHVSLSDFYIEYRLVCHALQTRAEDRARAAAELNAHVLDVFNEYGVQIMSPHYLGDPSSHKVVPKEGFSPPPARPPPPTTSDS
jgi:small-conductance mechanosensitive channel